MIKKNYKYLLTFIHFCSCNDKPGTIRKEYSTEQKENFIKTKQNFLDKFSENEISVIAVQGFYNLLVQFDDVCKDNNFEGLIIDKDISKNIFNAFLFLYGSYKEKYLGLEDEEQQKFLLKKIQNCKIVLEEYLKTIQVENNKNSEHGGICSLLSRIDYIFNTPEKIDIPEKKDFETFKGYIMNLFEQRNNIRGNDVN